MNTEEKRSGNPTEEEILKGLGGFSFGHLGKRATTQSDISKLKKMGGFSFGLPGKRNYHPFLYFKTKTPMKLESEKIFESTTICPEGEDVDFSPAPNDDDILNTILADVNKAVKMKKKFTSYEAWLMAQPYSRKSSCSFEKMLIIYK